MRPLSSISIRSLLLPLAALLLGTTNPDPGPNALYLCMYCNDMMGLNTGAYVENYLSFQAANGNRAVGIGNYESYNEEQLDRAKKAGVKVYGTGYERTVFLDQLADRKERESPKEAAKRNILAQLMKLDKTKPITIHISDHGWNGGLNGDGTLPPEKSGMAVKMQSNPFEEGIPELILTHGEFAELLTKAGLTGPKAPPVRIVAEHCYGGGVHWISQQFPNVCTAAFTDNKNVNWISDDEAGSMWRYVGAEKKAGRTPTLFEGFYAGWSAKDREDSVGGALGSTQFVKDVLQKRGIQTEDLGQWTSLDWSTWNNFSTLTGDIMKKGKKRTTAEETPSCPSEYYILPKVTSPQVFTDAEKVINTLLPENSSPILDTYRQALKDLQQNEANYRQLAGDMKLRIERLRDQWGDLKSDEKAAASRDYTDSFGTFTDWAMGKFEETRQADLTKAKGDQRKTFDEYLKWRNQNAPILAKYFREKEYVDRFAELKTFTDAYAKGKVTEAEMNQYRRMLQCESLPL
ncbi:MAG: hypothetical protein JST04_10395 [Bdellovibrionales bacterium]|nr:hypothetical protein [Bdellovibrionales bacterium]